MVACFFGIKNHVATVALQQRRTINSELYVTIRLPEVIREIRRNQKQRRIIFHHDNASAHTSAPTKEFSASQKIELRGHPPDSSDLAPNNLFLYSYIKNKLRGQKFPHPKKRLTHSKCIFWNYLKQSGKNILKVV